MTANQTLLVALGQSFTSDNSDHAAQRGRPRPQPRGRGHRVLRLPQEPGSAAPVLGARSSTSTTATTSRRAARSTAARPTRGRRRRGGALAFGDVNATGAEHRRARAAAGAGHRRRIGSCPSAFAHRGRAEALLLRELVAVRRERPRVPARRRRVRERAASTSRRWSGALLVAAGDRRRATRDRPTGNGVTDQHRAPRPALRGAVEPPGQARPLRAGGADADHRRSRRR